MEFLILEVDGARFGVPTSDVREVLRAASLGTASARRPNMLGMLNYRGQVLGVLELACLRGWKCRELTPLDHLIILQFAGQLFALRVDRAVEIMTWSQDDAAACQPTSSAQPLDDSFHAIAHPRWGVVYLLDSGELWSELQLEQSRQPMPEVEAT